MWRWVRGVARERHYEYKERDKKFWSNTASRVACCANYVNNVMRLFDLLCYEHVYSPKQQKKTDTFIAVHTLENHEQTLSARNIKNTSKTHRHIKTKSKINSTSSYMRRRIVGLFCPVHTDSNIQSEQFKRTLDHKILFKILCYGLVFLQLSFSLQVSGKQKIIL